MAVTTIRALFSDDEDCKLSKLLSGAQFFLVNLMPSSDTDISKIFPFPRASFSEAVSLITINLGEYLALLSIYIVTIT